MWRRKTGKNGWQAGILCHVLSEDPQSTWHLMPTFEGAKEALLTQYSIRHTTAWRAMQAHTASDLNSWNLPWHYSSSVQFYYTPLFSCQLSRKFPYLLSAPPRRKTALFIWTVTNWSLTLRPETLYCLLIISVCGIDSYRRQKSFNIATIWGKSIISKNKIFVVVVIFL